MPLKVQVFSDDKKRKLHECKLNDCGSQCCRCTYVKANGEQCKLHSCYDFEYCWIHLKKKFDVRIATSNITVDGKSIGKGLFARTNKPLPANLLRRLKSRRATREERKKYLVFKKNDKIGKYKGEALDRKRLDDRYRDIDNPDVDYTAPYGIQGRRGVLYDSLCKRNYVSYSNDARNSRYQYNAKVTTHLNLIATKNIWQGEEIFWNYKRDYWRGPLPIIKQKRYR